MRLKIIITGAPESGKSSLISRFITHFGEKGYLVRGFITPEVQEKGKRIGFDS